MLILEKRPLHSFSKSLVGLKYLQFIQHDIETLETTKKQTKIRYLNQSYLIHLVALWEIFVESQVTYTFTKMIQINPLGVFETMLRVKMYDAVERLHTPSEENINRIFKEILGIDQISDTWTWEKMPLRKSRDLLKEILKTRNEIAHESLTKNGELSFAKNFEYMHHLYNLAYIIDYSVNKYLATLAGENFEVQMVIPHPHE